ncbi:MAG: c-type cytochrome [Pseudomonadota bacterium]
MGVSARCWGILACVLAMPGSVLADDDVASYAVAGKYFDARDQPTYQIAPDGTVDWYTAHGFEAYRATCESCHGPHGAGSEYGSALVQHVETARYFDFTDITVNGQFVQAAGSVRVMPAFGTNPDVMCSLDAIYIYLRAEAAGVLRSGAPPVATEDNAVAADQLAECLRE